MKNRNIFFIVLLILIFGTLSAKSNKPDAVYHLISKSYRINQDGSMDYHFRKEVQVFSNHAFTGTYGETFILYNTDFQTLKINEAYVIRKDGSKVETPANAFNPSLPFSCTDCERFNNMREMVVTHTALEYEATIVLDYSIHSAQPFMKEIMEEVNLYEDAPIDKYEITVTVPDFMKLYYQCSYNGDNMLRDGRREADSSITTHWIFTKLAQLPYDANMPEDELPVLSFTTSANPEDFMMALTLQNAFMLYSNNDYSKVFDKILDRSKSQIDNVLAIRDYVLDNIHTNDLPMRYLNYIVASPAVVWKTNCGTPVEKALLLQSMLQSANYTSKVGFMMNHLMGNPEPVVQVFINNVPYYLSVIEKNAVSLDYRDIGGGFISTQGDVTMFPLHPFRININSAIQIVNENNILKAHINHKVSEIQSPKAIVMSNADLQLTNATINSLGANYFRISLKEGDYGCPIMAANLNLKRETSVQVPPTNEEYAYEILLPERSQWIMQSVHIQYDKSFGSMLVEMTVKDNILTIHRKLSLNQARISAKEYKDFRKMMADWDASHDLIFKY